MKPPNAMPMASFSSIELACAVRQPSPCVRALCETGVLFHMSHLKLHVTLPTWQSSHFTLHSSHCTLHTSHCTLFALHTLHTSHCTLRTPHFTLHTAHFTAHTSHCTLRTRNVTLHSPHFTLHSSCPTLHTAPFISSELFSPYPSWALLISSLLICHLSFHESLPSTTTKELACAVRQPGLCVRALCEAVAMLLSKNMTCARPRCNATWSKHFPHTSHCALHTSHLSSFHLVSCLPICATVKTWYWFHGHQFRGYRSSRLPIASHSGSSLLAKKRMYYINISICICISIYRRISRLSISIYIYR